ncbi:MAG: class I SAM-dependent methyltransferase [Actinobacteria bacterium]|nr:class I SAM-dependent methyltransferase [Actinomycetota bacterium]
MSFYDRKRPKVGRVTTFDPTGVEHRRFFYEQLEESCYQGCPGIATRSYQNQILKHIPVVGNGRYLELGSHSLELTGRIIEKIGGPLSLSALDLAYPKSLAKQRARELILQGRGISIDLVQGDASQLPLRANSLDVIFHGCLLHHLERPLECLNEVRRVLRPGGVAIFYVPCDPGLLLRIAQRLVTQRAARRLMSRESLSVRYLWAIEHRNHFASLSEMIRNVFLKDHIQVVGYPISWRFWNLKLFDVVLIRKV